MKKILQILIVVLFAGLLFACYHPLVDDCDCDCQQEQTIYQHIKDNLIGNDIIDKFDEVFDIEFIGIFNDAYVFIVCFDQLFGQPTLSPIWIGPYLVYQPQNWLQGILVLVDQQLLSLSVAVDTKIISLTNLSEIIVAQNTFVYSAAAPMPIEIYFDFLATIRSYQLAYLANRWAVIDNLAAFEQYNQNLGLGIDAIETLIDFNVNSLMLVQVHHSSSWRIDAAHQSHTSEGVLFLRLKGHMPFLGHTDIINTFILLSVDKRVAHLINEVELIVPLLFDDLDPKIASQISSDFRIFMQADDEFEIDVFYGKFSDAYVIMFSHPAWQMTGEETIEGIVINYADSRRIFVWLDGNFYRLQEAFDAKILTIDDIELIAHLQRIHLGW